MNPTLSDLGFTPTATGAAPAAAAGGSSSLSDLGFSASGAAPAGQPTAPQAAPDGGATGQENPVEAAGNIVKNFVPSLVNFGVGAVKAPIEGLLGLKDIPGAVADLWKGNTVVQPGGKTVQQGGGFGGLLSGVMQMPQTSYTSLVPQAVQKLLPVANDILGVNGGTSSDIGRIPGTMIPLSKAGPDYAGASAALQNDPVGTVAPIVLAGMAAAHAISPEVGAAFEEGVSKFAKPSMTAAGAVGDAASATKGFLESVGVPGPGTLVRYGLKGLTGLDASTIQRVIANPEEYSPDKIAATTRVNVAQAVKDALDAREAQLSESGKGYAPIRQSETPIHVNPSDLSDQIQSVTGLKPVMAPEAEGAEPTIQLEPKSQLPTSFARSTTGSVLSPGDVSKLNAFYKTWSPVFEKGEMLPQELLNMRSELATISHYEGIGKSSPLEAAAQRMRGAFNTKYRPQVKGLEELDADQTAHRTELKDLGHGLLDKEGNLRDSDINKIANATGRARAVLLSQLEGLVPGITERLNALRAAEDIRDVMERHKVGTYARAITGSGLTLGGIFTGNIPLIIGGITEAIITSPSVAIPLLRAYGFSKEITAGVMANLSSIASAANELPNGADASLGKLTPKLKEGAGVVSQYFEKNPVSLGLSLKDVTRDAKPYAGEKNLTLDTLEQLKGRTTVSKQFIEDLTNRGGIKQFERDTVRKALEDEGQSVNVADFAAKVKSELLPLKRTDYPAGRYENITLPKDVRGPVADYGEHIYGSPIKTTAGETHFEGDYSPEAGADTPTPDNYFAHTRTEDLPTKGNYTNVRTGEKGPSVPSDPTRRVIELQSDLFQKGGLEKSMNADKTVTYKGKEYTIVRNLDDGKVEVMGSSARSANAAPTYRTLKLSDLDVPEDPRMQKLEPYRNTWHERIIREEVKQAAKDGKTRLQFPTGETAMHIEGLGQSDLGAWRTIEKAPQGSDFPYKATGDLDADSLKGVKPGQLLDHLGNQWIVTSIDGDGRFSAMPLRTSRSLPMQDLKKLTDKYGSIEAAMEKDPEKTLQWHSENFDVSGKVDTQNPIYRFYDKTVGKYLVNHYGAQQVTDPQGVKWMEVKVKPEYKKLPITAMGASEKTYA